MILKKIFSIEQIENKNSLSYKNKIPKTSKTLIRETLYLIFFFKIYNYDSNIGVILLNLLIPIFKNIKNSALYK